MKDMTKMAKLVIVLLIITVASFAIAGAIFFAEYGGDNFKSFTNEGIRPANATDIDEEKTQDVSGINKIYVNTSSDSVNIIKTDSNKLKAHFYGYIASNRDYKPEFTFAASGDELTIKVEYPSLIGSISVNSNLKLDIYLPAGYEKNLDIQTSSGSVKTDDINKLESFSCRTSSGSLEAGTVNAGTARLQASSGSASINGTFDSFEFRGTSGSFRADSLNATTASLQTTSGSIRLNGNFGDLSTQTSSGSVFGEQVFAKSCRTGSTSGSVNLKGNPGKVDATASSGNVNLEYNEFASDITANTSSGSIRIKLPATAEFHVTHKTSSGNRNIAFPVTINGNTDEHGIDGTVVSDRNTINATTSSGSLEITK